LQDGREYVMERQLSYTVTEGFAAVGELADKFASHFERFAPELLRVCADKIAFEIVDERG
jgi:hypothetical protein